jgi:hypothetical protein
METEKIYVGIDDKRIELKGADLTAFLDDRATQQATATAREAQAQAKVDARTSALNKLSALGLTQEEIDSL